MSHMILITHKLKMVKLIRRYLSTNKIKLDWISSYDIGKVLQQPDRYLAVLIDTSGFTSGSLNAVMTANQKHSVPIILLNGSQDNVKQTLSMFHDLYSFYWKVPKQENTKIWLNPYVVFDLNEHLIINRNQLIPLPCIEYKLLKALCKKSPNYLSTRQLLDIVWGENKFVNVDTVYVHIRRLRQKIETNPDQPIVLINRKGVGYRVKSDCVESHQMQHLV
ncbi:response regulator transcription factor [Kroppenstedtia pulmonis]|uniref:Response regulator transcription factor n=1 Tax=Kroppenstedtia pulmonis TaxID=1380685 RepID=A0A7D4CPJ9_9BACL|nr:winged helix-turn-helix domain-containing protein [Kroppenstedtia pulmonis]QKG85398.1 response regulator transcription factor [Kroppenstedtia pulmonis]